MKLIETIIPQTTGLFFFNKMEPEPRYVKIVKILAIKVFPALIFGILLALLLIPAPKKKEPLTAASIDEQIERLKAEKASLQGH